MVIENSLIKKDVQNAINFAPSLKSHNIIVNVENGIVILSGSVENFYEKPLVEKIVKNVYGVKGVVDELQVIFGESLKRSDEEIAKAAVRSLEWDASIPSHKIKVVVEHGIITLSGEIESYHQRSRAYEIIKYLFGIKSVINNITLKPSISIKPETVFNKILSEFHRNACLDARRVRVEVQGNKIILEGFVRSWSEYEEARRAAWSVPGVTEVNSSQLTIDYANYYNR